MSAPKQSYLIVDGHSMIFAWDEVREMHAMRPAMARDELVRRLTAYQDISGERVVLVFDGRSGIESASRDEQDIQVIFSEKGGSADAVIERLAVNYGKKHRLTVASRDRAVLESAGASGADCIAAIGLRELLERSERRLDDLLRRRLR